MIADIAKANAGSIQTSIDVIDGQVWEIEQDIAEYKERGEVVPFLYTRRAAELRNKIEKKEIEKQSILSGVAVTQ